MAEKPDNIFDVTPRFLGELESWFVQKGFKRNTPTTGLAGPVGSVIAYTEFSTATLVTAGVNTEAAPLDVVSAGAVTFDGVSSVAVEFNCSHGAVGGAAGAMLGFNLWDTTDLGRLTWFQNNVAAVLGVAIYQRRILTPTAGTHTFKVRAWAVTANGSFNPGAGGAGVDLPGFIRITKA